MRNAGQFVNSYKCLAWDEVDGLQQRQLELGLDDLEELEKAERLHCWFISSFSFVARANELLNGHWMAEQLAEKSEPVARLVPSKTLLGNAPNLQLITQNPLLTWTALAHLHHGRPKLETFTVPRKSTYSKVSTRKRSLAFKIFPFDNFSPQKFSEKSLVYSTVRD
ncbi:hypothetical protein QAD02_012224 [Eretmocerus hayati]|uniref:Uncharacterized protein n=1 Tax=Eretmocerus hayati TaxID=131215 RepID=A0ACC2P1V3_9HYME|nr:hypothetical protein QAD02_012224 [Eretmocerus hayati]